MADIFTEMLSDAGVPTTADEMQEAWDALNEAEDSLISNNSDFSPFWRLISAIVTTPCKNLVKLLVNTALPNVFLKYASGSWLDVYAWAVDLTRKEGTAAVGVITFTRDSSAGELTVPASTEIQSPSIDGAVYSVLTTEDYTIPDGTLSADIPVQAADVGSAYNLGPGYYTILAKPISGIASVTNGDDWETTAGADEEEDDALRLRARLQFSAVGQYHSDAAYRADIASFAGIRTDYLYFEHGAPRGAGSANCYVMLASGAPSQTFVDKINTYITDSGHHGHGDSMICYPMPRSSVDLNVTVYPVDNLTDDEQETLRQAVEDRVRCAFRDNEDFDDDITKIFPYARFAFSRLDKELHDALDNLMSVVFDHADIVSEMDLPKLGTLNVVLGDA